MIIDYAIIHYILHIQHIIVHQDYIYQVILL